MEETTVTAGDGDRASLVTTLARAGRLRCPGCGDAGLVRGWVGVGPACPGCGLRVDRGEDDHFLGAMALNLVVAELSTAAVVLAVLLATWPEPPWRLLTWGGAGLAALLPVAFYPFAKLLWLAFDLRFRPEGDAGSPGGTDGARSRRQGGTAGE